MSFSSSSPRSGITNASVALSTDDGLPEVEAPTGSPYDETTDWGRVGTLAAGIVIGAVIGAGAALLLAPQSGHATRKSMGRAVHRGRDRAGEAWDSLSDELWWQARRKKKALRRGTTRTGWMFEDLIENIVGPLRGHGRPRQHQDDKDNNDDASRGRVVVEEE